MTYLNARQTMGMRCGFANTIDWTSPPGIYAFSSNDIKVGSSIEVDGFPWRVIGNTPPHYGLPSLPYLPSPVSPAAISPIYHQLKRLLRIHRCRFLCLVIHRRFFTVHSRHPTMGIQIVVAREDPQ